MEPDMALWHLFFIYRKSENNALESLVFHSGYASKSYQDPNTGNLMNKQGSFWMILSRALAASPEVVLEAMRFPQFFEVRTVWPPYLSWFICKMEGWSFTHARAEDREYKPRDSMSWDCPTSDISQSSPYFVKSQPPRWPSPLCPLPATVFHSITPSEKQPPLHSGCEWWRNREEYVRLAKQNRQPVRGCLVLPVGASGLNHPHLWQAKTWS